MLINFSLGVVAFVTVLQFILGALWYSPLLFGKWWMQIMEVTHLGKVELQKMQKEMMPFYFLQLLLTFISAFNLASMWQVISFYSVYSVATWILFGFIIPTQIACVIWGNTKKKYWLKQIFIMVSYQTVSIFMAAFIFANYLY